MAEPGSLVRQGCSQTVGQAPEPGIEAGADPQSSTKYLRNIGDKEKKSEELKFDSLGSTARP